MYSKAPRPFRILLLLFVISSPLEATETLHQGNEIVSESLLFRDGHRTAELSHSAFDRAWLTYPGVTSFPVTLTTQILVTIPHHLQSRLSRFTQSHGLSSRCLTCSIRNLDYQISTIEASSIARMLTVAKELTAYLPQLDSVSVLPNYAVKRKLFVPEQFEMTPDPRAGDQWYHDMVNLQAAWEQSEIIEPTKVVIIDNGCDDTHPDLEGILDPGYDAISEDDDPSPVPAAGLAAISNHGTACLGAAAADTYNGIGIHGACEECRAACVRLIPDDRSEVVPVSADVEAFTFAMNYGADVVSNSWGYADAVFPPTALQNMITTLIDEGRDGLGTVILFAAGNDDRELQSYELTGIEGVMTITGVSSTRDVGVFTNYGEDVDFAAPFATFTTDISGPGGEDPSDYTSSFGGTSSACPFAAGMAAYLLGIAPETSLDELQTVFEETANLPSFVRPNEDGKGEYLGYGIIDLEAAASALLENAHGQDETDSEEDSEESSDEDISDDEESGPGYSAEGDSEDEDSDSGCHSSGLSLWGLWGVWMCMVRACRRDEAQIIYHTKIHTKAQKVW